jgi:hypothetical protein
MSQDSWRRRKCGDEPAIGLWNTSEDDRHAQIQTVTSTMSTEVNVDLWLSFNDVYTRALSIPVEKCTEVSVNPLKWLRFLGFTIYGQEGYISTSAGGPEVSDYETDVQPGNYYFISERKLHFCVAGCLAHLLR